MDFCIFKYCSQEELANFGEMDYALSAITDTALEQVKKTGKVIFPYVRPEQKYFISVYFYKRDGNDGIVLIDNPAIRLECIPYSGIYLQDNIELILNGTHTNIALSAEPIFSDVIEYAPDIPKYYYFYDIKWSESALSKVQSIEDWEPFMIGWHGHTDELSIDFSPLYGLKNYIGTGNYSMYFVTYCNIIYNEVLWTVEIAKSEQFILSL